MNFSTQESDLKKWIMGNVDVLLGGYNTSTTLAASIEIGGYIKEWISPIWEKEEGEAMSKIVIIAGPTPLTPDLGVDILTKELKKKLSGIDSITIISWPRFRYFKDGDSLKDYISLRMRVGRT